MSAAPQRRSGLCWHSSASQRLCARAPAMPSSGSVSPDRPSPVPNGAQVRDSTASASGKMTSPAMPSASSSWSRLSASQPAFSASPCSAYQESAKSLLRTPRLVISSSAMPRSDEELIERGVVLALQIRAVGRGRQPGVAVGRDDQIGIHEMPLSWQLTIMHADQAAPVKPTKAGQRSASCGTSPTVSGRATSSTVGPTRAACGASASRSKP